MQKKVLNASNIIYLSHTAAIFKPSQVVSNKCNETFQSQQLCGCPTLCLSQLDKNYHIGQPIKGSQVASNKCDATFQSQRPYGYPTLPVPRIEGKNLGKPIMQFTLSMMLR